jgi:hypothetical protein
VDRCGTLPLETHLFSVNNQFAIDPFLGGIFFVTALCYITGFQFGDSYVKVKGNAISVTGPEGP